ncbi:hypothetical protein O181_025177 [Austropuccinia psidii MF-1]|uniref:Uncharacterized protein n=1 Tax=Austropuccinia psidii MF-1 TaxID=1389203 RepID=A0A9Q3CN05_9BASI|nr:hypothetical protein [Austropuccinia psidii MF-1]
MRTRAGQLYARELPWTTLICQRSRSGSGLQLIFSFLFFAISLLFIILTMTTATSHHIKDGQHSPVLANYDLTCFKTCNAEEDNHFIVMPYLNIETRGRIIGMQQAGLPFQAISDLVEILLSTIYNTVAKFQVIGTVRTQKKTGRPPIMTDQDQRELDRIITRCRRLTVAQVTDLMTHHPA